VTRKEPLYLAARLGVVWTAVVVAGCYEIPPEISPNAVRSTLPVGWPPVPVYSEDPFHVANRWFQRAYSRRGGRGELGGTLTAWPYVPERESQSVDRAELLALLEALAGVGLATTDPLSSLILHADLLAEAERRKAAGDLVLSEAYLRALRAVPVLALETRPEFLPPPLRTGVWRRVEGDLASGLDATPRDLRGSTVYYDVGDDAANVAASRPVTEEDVPRRAALVRTRVVLGASGEWISTKLASEGWFLERREDGVEPRLFRFERSLAGRAGEPWTEIEPDSETAIRDPLHPEGPLLKGTVRELCLSCHPTEAPFLTRREGFFVTP